MEIFRHLKIIFQASFSANLTDDYGYQMELFFFLFCYGG